MSNRPDVEFLNHGSVCMVVPLTDAAKDWVEENLALESWQWLGGGFACEPRYAGDLAEGMSSDGLIVS